MWDLFVAQAAAGSASISRPEWDGLSDTQIAYLQEQQQKADVHLERIVAHLMAHGEMSTVNLAADMGWKPDTAYRRCDRGVEKGVIRKEVRWAQSRRDAKTNVTFWRAT